MSNPKEVQYDLDAKEDDKTIAVFSHVLSIFAGILGSFIAFMVFKDRSSFLRFQMTTLLNFWITMSIAGAIAVVLSFVLIGFFLIPIVVALSIIFPIIASIQANDGALYQYPIAIKFLK